MDSLTRLSVMVERLSVPSLAMARDGIILFANTAFAATFHTVPRRRKQSHSVETSDRISEPA